jgi:hypothetical protein
MGGPGRSRKHGDDHIDLQPDKVGCELGETLGLALRRPELDEEIVAFRVTKLAQTLTKGGEARRSARSAIEDPDSMRLSRRLRLDGGRRNEKGENEGENAETPYPRPRVESTCRRGRRKSGRWQAAL